MIKDKKKILFIHPYFGNGGAEKGIKILSKYLVKDGYLIHLYCLKIDDDIEEKLTDISIIKSSSTRIIFSIFKFFKLLWINKYSIVVPTQSPSISFYVPIVLFINFILKDIKIKILSFERLSPKIFYRSGSFKILRKFLYYFSLRNSDCILTNSLEQLSHYNYLFPGKKSFYIPNSSSTNHIKTESIKKNKYDRQNLFKILWLGRFEVIKDPLLAIDTMHYLNNEFYLNMFGNGSMLDQIKMRINYSKFEKRINIYNNNQKLDFNEYDIILHTSFFEGLPNTFIEALKENIPVVSTIFTTGLCELFIPYWIYPSERSSFILAEQIKEALSEKHKKIRKNSNIDQLISNFYNDKNMFKGFKNALNNL